MISGLKSLPNLRKLSITLKNTDEEAFLINELPYLEILNNEKISKKSQASNKNIPQNLSSKAKQEQTFQKTPESVEKSSLKQEDLESLSNVYDAIRQIHKEINPEGDLALAEQFDEHVKNILFDLNAKLEDPNIEVAISKSLTVKAKYALYEICFSKFMEILDGIDPRLANILESLHDSHALIFKEMSSKSNIFHLM